MNIPCLGQMCEKESMFSGFMYIDFQILKAGF